jgi:SAM-dependent methyltransferase
MQTNIWEDYISLNSHAEPSLEVIGPAKEFVSQADGSVVWDVSRLSVKTAVSRDTSPLPLTEHREGYYGPNHYNFWASGLRDWFQILEWCEARKVKIESILDMGCASGRLLRHLHYQSDVKNIMGCDINRFHVDWVARNLPREICVFQNTSIPTLPIPDSSVDFVSAFSVFTHIESFDTTWLMELRRILRPGGIAWLTFHGDRVWRDIKPTWPLYGALDTHPGYKQWRQLPELPQDRTVFRWHSEKSYSANIFYREDYIRNQWGRYLDFVEIIPCLPNFQDICILRNGRAK